MAGFMTYWSKDYIKSLHKAGDHGALTVIFGSHHTSMPSISRVKVGDVIYPVTLAEGTLCVMGKLPVEKIEIAFDYLMRETGQQHSALVPDGFAIEIERSIGGVFYQTSHGCVEDPPERAQILRESDLKSIPHKFHQEPQTCCAAFAASGIHGSMITVRPLPLEVLPELRFGPAKSEKKPLKLDKNAVPIISTLSGFLRCMSEATQEQFERLFLDL